MSRLELPDDFRDVLVALADAQADFLLIGGWAMAVHGAEGPAYRIRVKPLRIEVLTKISGVSFDEAASDPVHAEVDGRVVPVIGRHALLRNERSAGRHKDLDDAEWLEVHGRA